LAINFYFKLTLINDEALEIVWKLKTARGVGPAWSEKLKYH